SENLKLEAAPDFIFPYGGFDWSPDGSRLIFTEAGFGLRRWRVDTDDWVRLYDAESQPASQVAWSPNGRYIASGHYGGTVCVWNVWNNQCEGFIRAHFNSVDGLAWSPDSKQIATASGAIRIWDIKTGEEEFAFGYAENINYTQLEWVSEQTTATLETSYTQNISPSIKFWDVSTGDVTFSFRGWQDLRSPNYDGVSLIIDDIQISGKETIIQTSLIFDY
ncbi:MAG: WD40 repeat domain-containing protein, partial [Anaerolineales bacterium]